MDSGLDGFRSSTAPDAHTDTGCRVRPGSVPKWTENLPQFPNQHCPYFSKRGSVNEDTNGSKIPSWERCPMAINIAEIEQLVREMSVRDAPGRSFCAAVAELARTGRFSRLRQVLPPVVYEELRERYSANPAGFVAGWRQLAQEMHQGLIQHARERLTSLTRVQNSGHRRKKPVWQEIQRALDGQENNLLRTAFALELLEMIEPAVARATELRECEVAGACSEESDRYLGEATRCYFLGLFTACAVMCRSVLEEAIRQKLPPSLARLVKTRYRNTATLGNLLHEVNNNLQLTGIDPQFPRLANLVNDCGKKAVHRDLLSEGEARLCLQSAREALQLLLSR